MKTNRLKLAAGGIYRRFCIIRSNGVCTEQRNGDACADRNRD